MTEIEAFKGVAEISWAMELWATLRRWRKENYDVSQMKLLARCWKQNNLFFHILLVR